MDNDKIETNNKDIKRKKKDEKLSFSKNDENTILDRDVKIMQNKLNGLFIKDFEDELKSENNINRKKKANSHRKKYFSIIPKLNISNANTGNNYKKKMNIHIMNYINSKDNNYIYLKNNSNYNFPKTKNSFNFINFNKNINNANNKNKNKNYIFSYLNTDTSRNREKLHQRNLSSGIKNHIKNENNSENNKILFGTKLGLLSKINLKNNYNKKNLSRNFNNINSEMSRTKHSDYTNTLDKNNYMISPRTLEQKTNDNKIKNIEIYQDYKGLLNLKNDENNKHLRISNDGAKNLKGNINNRINLTNINNIGNHNNSFGINNNFIKKCYLNSGNIINNSNNIILNIQNYYNRKNNKTYENK